MVFCNGMFLFINLLWNNWEDMFIRLILIVFVSGMFCELEMLLNIYFLIFIRFFWIVFLKVMDVFFCGVFLELVVCGRKFMGVIEDNVFGFVGNCL